MTKPADKTLHRIVNEIISTGGRAFQVGGCVRDELLGLSSKDVDIEVFDLDPEILLAVLKRFGRVDCVGVSFGVIKLRTRDGREFDFTLPRRENKTGRGHRGFQVDVDHTMTIAEASARRDFTINAIYRNALSGEIVDPHNGQQHLKDGVLQATSPHFAEDPLRVLRAMQLAARFDLTVEKHTAELAQSLLDEYDTLAVERVWGEWHKWAARSIRPSKGLTALQDCGWLSCYPELAALIGVPQDPEWHPEGDVWIHTLLVCDAAAVIADREELNAFERSVLLFAALCHDFGKATTTEKTEGRWRAHGHCKAGVPLSETFLQRIGCPRAIVEVVEPLVAEHRVHANSDPSPRTVRRLANRLGKASIRQLVWLIEADMNGRPPRAGGIPESATELLRIAAELDVQNNQPQPIVQGRHLIELGYTPGPWFGEIIAQCFEAQLDGEFETLEDGLEFLRAVCRTEL